MTPEQMEDLATVIILGLFVAGMFLPAIIHARAKRRAKDA